MCETTPFLGAGTARPGGWTILGAPLDQTASFRPGAARGPREIRLASHCLEEYCPRCDRSLADVPFTDGEDLALDDRPLEAALALIRSRVAGILQSRRRPLLLGGEHTVTLPAVQAAHAVHPELAVMQFDAHADLRDRYQARPLSHACVMRRVVEVIGPDRLFQVGVRSGTREEFEWMRTRGTILPATREGLEEAVHRLDGRPLFVTLDLDVLDPAQLTGTGSPEPGGLSFPRLEGLLRLLKSARVVGADVVELAPAIDPTGMSAVVAARLVRTMLLEL